MLAMPLVVGNRTIDYFGDLCLGQTSINLVILTCAPKNRIVILMFWLLE
jgi:hypothetical protein